MRSDNRKDYPLARGVLDYFPDALLEVANVSKIGNDQHNPGEPMHWAKEKSTDEPDALLRHLIDRGKRDTDGVRHSAKVAWRGLALLQREIDAEKGRNAQAASGVMVKSAMTGEETPLKDMDIGPNHRVLVGESYEYDPDELSELSDEELDAIEDELPSRPESRPKGSEPGFRGK